MSAVTAILDEMIDVLEQSEGLCQALLTIAEREKAAALGYDHRELARTAAEKEEVLTRLNRTERKRIDLVQRIADDLKLSPTQLCLSELGTRANSRQATRIESLRSSLGGLAKAIKRINAENRQLIQHCLDLSRNALSFFQRWMMPAAVYGASGRMSSNQRSGKLLSGTV
jgi:flagellar biosynthesis/type III secretory pathway chaperone